MVAESGADVGEGVDDGLALVPVDAREDVETPAAAGEVVGAVDVVLRGGGRRHGWGPS